MSRAATVKIGIGAVLIAASCVQVVAPARLFQDPQDRFLGLPLVPVCVLGLCATLFTVGVIVASEGICDAVGGRSLWGLATADPMLLLWLLACGALSGVVMEVVAQWLGRLWYYPYWTPWFYALILVPGFTFYWVSIVESYLAAKAVLDTLARPRSVTGFVRLWPVGLLALALSVALSIRWYALLAVIGIALLSGALVTAAVKRYWVPFAAIGIAAVVLSVAMEIPNAVHKHWAYAHFPGPAGPAGLPWSVFVAWPLQYLVFLAIPSVILPRAAALFWRPPERGRRQ